MLRLAFLGALVTACNPPENVSVHVSAAYIDTLRNTAPVGWWRLGELQGSVAYDETFMNNHGQYHNVNLDEDGAVVNDTNRANFYLGQTDSYVEVADRQEYSLTKAYDNFNRPCFSTPNCTNVTWGAASTGESWQVESGFGAYYNTDSSHAFIDPDGATDVFQQGLPAVPLNSGEVQIRATWNDHPEVGVVRPVALVHRMDSDNHVRAELREKEDKILEIAIIKTIAGVETELSSAWIRDANNDPVTYEIGDWWYLRVQFDGAHVSARAWREGTEEPCAWLVDGDGAPIDGGTVSIRYSNLESATQPTVWYEGLWVQYPGLSYQMFVNISAVQPSTQSSGDTEKVHLFGKGTDYDIPANPFDHGNQEYHLRWLPAEKELKAYVFNLAGNLGAGQSIPNVDTGRWYHVIVVLSPGDALDQTAGITMYVNGQTDTDGQGDSVTPREPPLGSYDGAQHCDGAVAADPLVCSAEGAAGVPGECGDIPFFGNGNTTCGGENCWTIYPFCGDAPLLFGTADKDDWFRGGLDEVAIWNRMLTKDEVQALFKASGL
jgi:hypothetical protein